ncbi:phosphatidylinositol-specific phospholipase C [Rhodococcus sp. NPDC049939]|uniref:phosphatidylinositol-specific phospholipase C n=1 Tax=Rhodococcus sp. NPDC049939 TaxID=3155511 RepID=UPI0033D403CE
MSDTTLPRRRTILRAFAMSPMLLLAPMNPAGATGSSSLGSSDFAAGSMGRGGLDTVSEPNWMRDLLDSANPTELSLVGTHDTMAYSATLIGATQDFDLATQLRAGVRVLDIRTRHYRDAFTIHHGIEYLNANYTDVVRTVSDFLRENPSETVLMFMQKAHTEVENTRSYEDTLNWYIHENPDTRDLLAEHLWTPPADYDGAIPDLGEIRGRFVIMRSFDATGVYGPNWRRYKDSQNDWILPSLTEMDTKWEKVRTHFERTAQGSNQTLFINGLNATSGEDLIAIASGVLPMTIAKGVPGIEGILARTEEYLRDTGTGRTGIVMADFPTAELVESVIARNFS